mgnify:CR=1 FL=1
MLLSLVFGAWLWMLLWCGAANMLCAWTLRRLWRKANVQQRAGAGAALQIAVSAWRGGALELLGSVCAPPIDRCGQNALAA